MKIFSHMPRVNADVIRLATDEKYRKHITNSFLEEVAISDAEDYYPAWPRVLRDIFQMREALQITGTLSPFNSLQQMRALHDGLVTRMNEIETGKIASVSFMAPPVPGTDLIIPLTSSSDLVQEGSDQSNCVASYVRNVLSGRCYIYRMLAPDRATISLAFSRGKWILDEITGKYNAKVNREAVTAVNEWLSKYYFRTFKGTGFQEH